MENHVFLLVHNLHFSYINIIINTITVETINDEISNVTGTEAPNKYFYPGNRNVAHNSPPNNCLVLILTAMQKGVENMRLHNRYIEWIILTEELMSKISMKVNVVK